MTSRPSQARQAYLLCMLPNWFKRFTRWSVDLACFGPACIPLIVRKTPLMVASKVIALHCRYFP